jgi:hypothetical protein
MRAHRSGRGIFDLTMTATAGLGNLQSQSKPSRRQRAAKTVGGALRGGLIAAAVAGVAWLLAVGLAATAFVVLVVATLAVVAYAIVRGDKARPGLWAALLVAWAIVLLERWLVNGHGGVWVAGAAWLGVALGARRAGISKWSLPLLLYPLVCLAIAVIENQNLLSPWGVSWLWVAAILGPVIGAQTLLNPSPRKAAEPPQR